MTSWLQLLSPMLNLRLPGGGDVGMDYRPWTNWGVSTASAGVPEIESAVFRDVALPGKQLGKLTEALLAIADAQRAALGEDAPELPEITALRDIRNSIEKKKSDMREVALADAEKALERLKDLDSAAFGAVIEKARARRDFVEARADSADDDQG